MANSTVNARGTVGGGIPFGGVAERINQQLVVDTQSKMVPCGERWALRLKIEVSVGLPIPQKKNGSPKKSRFSCEILKGTGCCGD